MVIWKKPKPNWPQVYFWEFALQDKMAMFGVWIKAASYKKLKFVAAWPRLDSEDHKLEDSDVFILLNWLCSLAY